MQTLAFTVHPLRTHTHTHTQREIRTHIRLYLAVNLRIMYVGMHTSYVENVQ